MELVHQTDYFCGNGDYGIVVVLGMVSMEHQSLFLHVDITHLHKRHLSRPDKHVVKQVASKHIMAVGGHQVVMKTDQLAFRYHTAVFRLSSFLHHRYAGGWVC